ncbi:MAG TPA: hypothetical protein VE258_12085 [Ktedonobacterales bacterium]|nr:hypothetical protein [Ktedonobacterales bacterium]
MRASVSTRWNAREDGARRRARDGGRAEKGMVPAALTYFKHERPQTISSIHWDMLFLADFVGAPVPQPTPGEAPYMRKKGEWDV